MLVLSRKRGEGIVIGPNIQVTVIDVRGGRVRLGIHASPDVPIFRKELLTRSGELDRQPTVDVPSSR